MRAALACGLMLLAGAALAQDAPAPNVSAEFVRLFSDYCLARFPGAVAQAAADAKLEPLTASQVASYLHSDTGKGWLIAGADSNYVLTEEDPPYNACAVRRYSDRMMGGAPLMEAARAFVEGTGRKLDPPQISSRPIGNGIISNAVLMQLRDAKDRQLPEAFMFFVVTYPVTTKPDGTESRPFYDIRFVRQIVRKKEI
jgi:hypothetical protein